MLLIATPRIPESPRWLVMKGRNDKALEVLEDLNEKPRDDPYIQTEFKAIQSTVVEMSKGSYRSLFEMSEYREFHRVVLAYVNQMFQQISGINLITYYVSVDMLSNLTLNLVPFLIRVFRLLKFIEGSALAQAICQSCSPLATVRST